MLVWQNIFWFEVLFEMKKKLMPILALILALMMVLTSCDSIPGRDRDDDDDRSSSSEDDDRRDRDKDKDDDDDDDRDKDKDKDGDSSEYDGEEVEGYLGDTLTTAFFDFCVKDVKCYSSLGGFTPGAGNKFLVLDLYIKNTETYSMPMFSDDFWLVWGSEDGEDAYPDTRQLDENQLPDEYKIPIAGQKEGTLVYEVPADVEDFMLVFVEIYDNEDLGDSFYVYFTADEIIGGTTPDTPTDPTTDPTTPSGATMGWVGDTLTTAFFDFTVSGAYYFSNINGYTPDSGKYLVLDLTIKNNQTSELPMFDTDFVLTFGTATVSTIYPVAEQIDVDQLPKEYKVPVGQSQTGYLVFDVPANITEFLLTYQEEYQSGRVGETYDFLITEDNIVDTDGSDPSGSGNNGTRVDGTEGNLGDILSTSFFDFGVSFLTDATGINDHTPSTGCKYLVVGMNILNTMDEAVPMYDTDFPLAYGDGDGDICNPITEMIHDDQLPEEYEIAKGENVAGYLIYEVPEDTREYVLGFTEYFTGGREGETYLIYLTLDQ